MFIASACSLLRTSSLLDDGVAELTQRPGGRIALHAHTVRHIVVEMRQHGVSHARPEHHLTLIVDLLVVERPVVDVEPFDRPLISVRLLHMKTASGQSSNQLTNSKRRTQIFTPGVLGFIQTPYVCWGNSRHWGEYAGGLGL